MKKDQIKPGARKLRQTAEKIMKKSNKDFSDESENLKLIHELSVHQIELELQNEELIAARYAERAVTDKYIQLYDFAPSGYLSLNKQGIIIELNLCAAKLLGRERVNLKMADFANFLKPGSKSLFKNFLTNVLVNNFAQTCEVTLENNFIIHLTGIYNNDLINLTAIDITNIRKVEEEKSKLLNELIETRKKIDLLLQNARIGSWEWYKQTGEIKIDDSLAEIFGITDEKRRLSFNDFEMLLQNEDISKIRNDFKESLEKRIPFESIFRIKEDYDNLLYLSAKAFINYDASQNPRGLTGVCIDITDIHESSERALIKLNNELSKSNKELQNFAYIASHDLQEPLRMVTSFVQLLENQYADKLDDRAHEYINFAIQGAIRMYELLNSLLDYSRIRTRQNILEEVDMNELLKRVLENIQLIIKEKDVKIKSENLPVIFADNNQMIQLLQNLIDNSIKFSKTKPYIHVSARLKENFYVFKITDRGIGIEQEYFERIFRIFQRLHNVQEYSGNGVGLAICKSIVERHGGDIWLESKPGKGTTFYFSIPVDPQSAS